MYEFSRQHEAPTTVYYWIAQIAKLQAHRVNLSRKANAREQANTEADSESNQIESIDEIKTYIYIL